MLLPREVAAQPSFPLKRLPVAFKEVTYSPEKTVFTLFAPNDAKKVVVRIYDEGLGGQALKTVKLSKVAAEKWQTTVKGDLMGKFYTFDVGLGECPGVFAKAVGVNGKRGAIIDMEATDPDHWCCDERPKVESPADLVIYEMHHRDFSIARQDAKYKGKFLALTEPWAIDHLKALGVNAVHILPSYDYGSVDETRLADNKYNWGYDPVNYNVPEGGYSTDPYKPEVRIREFKQMVQALHQAGIRVILDVVYNHTYDIENSNFQRTYPDYYYRKTATGDYSNGSGCGNETASDKPMMRQFMLESVKYWIEEYHIDGFRFDLMGVHDIETMNQIRKMVDEIDPSIYIYGEGWSAGSCAYPQEQLAMKAHISQMPRIGAFSDEIRDALRGPFSDDTQAAWLAHGNDAESIRYGIVGAIAHPQVDMDKVNYSKEPWAIEPTQMISYVSCHDDMCLVDRLKASVPGITTDELIRLDLLAQTAVFTSQGVPFMLSGEELLRDKKGVHNSFESPDEINHLDWTNKTKYPQVFDYYKGLIALRKHHPAFRLGSADLVRKHLEFLDAPEGVVAWRLKDYAGGDEWCNIVVVLNANKSATEVAIPEGDYTIVCCDGHINERGLGSVRGSKALVDPQSALILCERFPSGSFSPVTNVNANGYPRVLNDNRVMFRVNAPEAQKVQIDLCGKKYDMQRREGGIWTVTSDPQVPGYHYYFLVVDGVSTSDPASQSFYGCGRWSSAIEIPEAGTENFEVQEVPHGEVRTVHYYSKVDQAWRPLMVYTPAGYNEGKQKYPVVYIQHGGGEDHRGWMEQGRTAQILDNLIAHGKAVPMIVVSANSNVQNRNGGFGGGYSWQGMQAFRSELLDNVIPFVEKTFRVKKDRKSRAMCGLSMGGGQSFYIGLRSPEVFANVGVFSTGMFGGIAGAANIDLEKEVPGMLSDTKTFNAQHDVFYISCGEQDPRIEHTRNIVKKMREAGVEVEYNSFTGDHEWQVWRKSLQDFAPRLFK